MSASEDLQSRIEAATTAAERHISAKIEAATTVLQQSFEPALSLGASASGADPLQLIISAADSYSKDIDTNTSSFAIFNGLLSSINSMRSTYRPVEYLAAEGLANTLGSGDFSGPSIVDDQAYSESNENAFMRMLGMPSSAEFDEGSVLLRITSDGQLKYASAAEINEYVLATRQLDHSSRPYTVGDEYFSFSSVKALDLIPERLMPMYEDTVEAWGEKRDQEFAAQAEAATQGALGDPTEDNLLTGVLKVYWQGLVMGTNSSYEDINLTGQGVSMDVLLDVYTEELLGQTSDNTIESIVSPSNFFRLSYLLTPPVQDGLIVGCINEPNKIVASNFLPKALRKVNGNVLKSSFLEAVIRLRLDNVTGVDPNTVKSETDPTKATVGGVTVDSYEDAAAGKGYGILESLIVARLESAVAGMARYIKKNAQNLKLSSQRSRTDIDGNRPGSQGSPGQASNFRAFRSNFFPNTQDGPEAAASEQQLFETIVAVEDAINLFFADASEPYDLTKGTQRGSSMRNAHLMDSVISIVGQPGDVARRRLSELLEAQERRARKTSDLYQTGISTIIGNITGIGIIDIAVFLLSLFLIEEKFLLGLMTTTQLENMTLEYPADYFEMIGGETGVPTIETSMNELTMILYVTYKKFLGSVTGSRQFYYGGRVT